MDVSQLNCDSHPDREPHADVQWGGAGTTHVATFCKECCDDLWERLNPLLKTGQGWIRMDRPGMIKVESGQIKPEA